MSENQKFKSLEAITGEKVQSVKVPLPRVLKQNSDVLPVEIELTKDGFDHGLTLERYHCPKIDTYGIFIIEKTRFAELGEFDQIMQVDNKATEGMDKQEATSMIKKCWDSVGNPVLKLKIHKAKEVPGLLKFDEDLKNQNTEIILSPVKKAKAKAKAKMNHT